jgi:glycosyltransferase involved in cell wall biosynthesis
MYPDEKLLKWKAEMVEMMKQKGIVDHGRVSEKELTKLIAQSNLWTYYSHFWEINCIGAIMAQSLGAIPVTTDYAALDETVQFGVKVKGIKEAFTMPKEVEKELVKETINLLKDKVKQEKIRKPMMKWAKENYSWGKIVESWIKEKEKNA